MENRHNTKMKDIEHVEMNAMSGWFMLFVAKY